MIESRVRSAGRIGVAGLVAIISASAGAQTAPPVAGTPANGTTVEGDTIVVTGSRIARPVTDAPQPVATISANTIEKRGYTDVGRALTELPGFAVPDSSQVGTQGNGLGVGQTFINLYNLGSQRTLTLVNGRRFVGANPATIFSSAEGGTQVDLNTIPTKLISRIETVSIGGAPIYGSDAIAGTVNIILKRNYEGIDLDAQNGISQRGDLRNWRVRGLFGKNFAEGRGNVTLNVEYNKDAGLLGTDRSAIRRQRAFVQPNDPNSPYSLVLAENVRTYLGSEGGFPYFIDRGTIGPDRAIVDANGNYLQFAKGGILVPYNTGVATPDPTTFIGGDALNLADVTNLHVRDNRLNATLLLHYDIGDHVRAFAEGWYSRSRAVNLRDQPVYNTAFFRTADAGSFDPNGNYIVRLNNPFLSTQAREIIRQNLIDQGLPSGDDDGVFYVGRANTDLYSGISRFQQTLARVVGGFEGDFQLLNHKWNWQVSGNYGRTRSVAKIPSVVEGNLVRALNVTRDANGNIVCAPFNPDPNDPTAPPNYSEYAGTVSTTCAPLDIFGRGAPSQAARDYITTIAKTVAITSQRDFVATLGGGVLDLPGGPLAVSLGYENRREYSRYSPDAFYTQGLGRNVPFLGVKGSYTTNEAFGEFRAPLVGPQQDIPLIRELELNAAGRYVHNSASGNAFTWTAGGRWSPIRDFAFRGNFTRAIRAPAITELFVANQPAFDGGYDPCDASNLGSGPNPAVRQANCAAAGLPTDFASIVNSVTVPITVIGNPRLKNEYSKSWTVGAVFEPRFLRNLSLSVDYINIHLFDSITSSSAEDVLTACYDATNYPNNTFCSYVTRDQTAGENFGQVLTLQEPYINQGGRVFRAIELQASYPVRLPRDLGRVTLGVNYQHVLKEFTIINASSGKQNHRGEIGNSVDRANLELSYDRGAFSWYNQIRYVGPAVFDATEPKGTRDIPGVKSWAVWNTAFTYTVNEQLNLRFNIDNVTDVGLPYPASGLATQNTYYEGLAGRAFLVGAGVHF